MNQPWNYMYSPSRSPLPPPSPPDSSGSSQCTRPSTCLMHPTWAGDLNNRRDREQVQETVPTWSQRGLFQTTHPSRYHCRRLILPSLLSICNARNCKACLHFCSCLGQRGRVNAGELVHLWKDPGVRVLATVGAETLCTEGEGAHGKVNASSSSKVKV